MNATIRLADFESVKKSGSNATLRTRKYLLDNNYNIDSRFNVTSI